MPDEKQLLIEVRDKIATLKSKNFNLVGGNSDYKVVFDFDEDWENVNPKTAVFVFGKEEPIYSVFDGNTCEGVAINGASMCLIGVFAGDVKTTTPAVVECVYRSILDEANGTPQPPKEDVYNQIMGLLDKWLEYANDAATKKFVMDKVLPLTQTTISHDKRIKNLESRLPIGAFVEDSEIAYIKTVPTNACPYAEITKIGGKSYGCSNLIKSPFYFPSRAHKGIFFTDNGDGSITLNGKNDGTADSSFYFAHKDNQPITLESGTYTVSVTGSDEVSIIVARDKSYTGTFTLSSKTDVSILIRVAKGNTTEFNNVTVYPMLNKGSTALPHEPYYEGLIDTKVTALESKGANLINPVDFISASVFTIKISSNKDGAIILNGASNVLGSGSNVISRAFICTEGTYTFSAKDILPKKVILSLSKYIGGKWDMRIASISATNPTATFEWTKQDAKECTLSLDIDISVPISLNNILIYPMFNKGSTALPYTPYRTDAIDTFTIAEEIQSIDGYGQSDPDNPNEYNYIDFERKMFVAYGHMVDGQWVAYNETKKIDISEYLTGDNFIEVEGGASITAVNNNESKVPSTITYLMKTEAE